MGDATSAPQLDEKKSGGIAARRAKPLHVQTKVTERKPGAGRERVELIRRLEPGKKITDIYELDESIYEAGSKGRVVNAKCKTTGDTFVVKIRRKGHFRGSETIWRDIMDKVMNMDRCIHVLDFHEVIEDDDAYYVVMEKCGGGELFKFLLTETTVPERECKRIMREILNAVKHLHDQGIIHRDIKPENIMFDDSKRKDAEQARLQQQQHGKDGNIIKLIDFDTCQEYIPNSPKSKRIIGTLGYIAPEGYLGEYTPASDLWSVGVILYILMTGDMPFDDAIFGDNINDNSVQSSKMQDIYKKLRNAKVDWECPPWPQFPAARDLCQQLLAFDVECRSPSAADALSHSWLRD